MAIDVEGMAAVLGLVIAGIRAGRILLKNTFWTLCEILRMRPAGECSRVAMLILGNGLELDLFRRCMVPRRTTHSPKQGSVRPDHVAVPVDCLLLTLG